MHPPYDRKERSIVNILIIEDDQQIRSFLSYILEKEGYHPEMAATGKEGLQLLKEKEFQLILLDLGLPDLDGMQVIEKVRAASNLPILVISARDQDHEKADALDLGADDYLTKPFSTTELLARIRTALRHAQNENKTQAALVKSVQGLTIDLDSHRVFVNEKEIHLTPLEFSLLACLFEQIGKVYTTQAILQKVYGAQYGSDTRALRTLMASLRRKIEPQPAKPRYILTEIGVGYRLNDHA